MALIALISFFYLPVKQDKNTLILFFWQCINMWKLQKKTTNKNLSVFVPCRATFSFSVCTIIYLLLESVLLHFQCFWHTYWPRTSWIQGPVFGMHAIRLSNMVCCNVVICCYLEAPRGVDDLSRLWDRMWSELCIASVMPLNCASSDPAHALILIH